jgi:hypothetical protein
VRRRLLDLCLLAYPRGRRRRDGDYLRDLALELSEAWGLRRQALSLLRAGLGERIELRRRGGAVSPSTLMRRAVFVVGVLTAITLTVNGLSSVAAGESERVERDRFACVQTDHPRAPNPCAGTNTLVAARIQSGWECARRARLDSGRRTIAWRCALGEEPSAGSAR